MSDRWIAVFSPLGGYDCTSDAYQIIDVLTDAVLAEVDLRHYDCAPGSGTDAAEIRLAGEVEALRIARLIAAAPALLEALEDLEEWAATGKVDGVGFDEPQILETIRATLAIVKGV